MGSIYFDETLQPRAGFALGAFVWLPDGTEEPIAAALREAGMEPGVDEFKSGARMDRAPHLQRLRNRLQGLLMQSRVAVLVAPLANRRRLGEDALIALDRILTANGLRDQDLTVSLDEGLFTSVDHGETVAAKLGFPATCHLRFEQDSRAVLGLQLADLVAHTAGVMLLAQLGIVSKTVKAGPESGYDPDDDIELSFALWASLRYSFFQNGEPKGEDGPDLATVIVRGMGFFTADDCDGELAEAADSCFGECYLGCIH